MNLINLPHNELLLCPGEKFRGWDVAPAKGLFLMHCAYPPHEDPDTLMYPHLPHDEHGRVYLDVIHSQRSDPEPRR